MGAVCEAVEGGVCEDGVGEKADPFAYVAVARDDEAGVAVTLDDERIQVFGLLLAEAMETEVVHQEQVGSEVLTEGSFEAVVGARLAEFTKEVVGPPEEDGVAGTRCCRTQSLGEEGLADPDRADEKDVLLLLEEVQRKELVEVAAIELDGCRPVEVIEGDPFFEASLKETPFELLGVPALDLVGKDEREEGGVIELLGACEGQPVRQGRDRLAELEPFEEGNEVRFEAHAVASWRTV
jgi:hypothetical protein